MAGQLGWLAAAIALPVIAVGVWWQPVEAHPALTAGLLAAYTGAVAIGRGLWSRWQQRIIDRIELTLGRLTSQFDRRYREFMLNGMRFIDLKGLPTIGFYTPELDEVFVDVSLARYAASKIEDGVLAQLPPDITERLSIQDVLDRQDAHILAVVGVPGSGKTTLLRHTARRLCQDKRRRTVPMLLYLRDHAGTIADRPDVALADLLRDTLGRYARQEPAGWFEQRLQDGRCVVLLDGLDEVPRSDQRRSVADWIERQTAQYPRNSYVVTARPRGYRDTPINGAQVLQVRSFTHSQVTSFVQGWYLAVEKHVTGATGEEVGSRAQSAADNLLERLNGTPSLYDLTVNPLLLTMIANVHRDRGALPGSRSGLYSEICQVILWRRQEAKKLDLRLGGPKKEVLLRGLAFRMMREQVRDLRRQEVLDEFGRTLQRMSENVTAEDILADIRHHGLLIERENGTCSFAHQTFQEYFAAAHIRDRALSSVLEHAVDDVWWRETTVLYAAMSDADPIVRACLNSGSVTALSLAFDCAEVGRELDPELRQHLDELLSSALTPHADRDLRRLMIRVVTSNHFRYVTRTAGGSRVCSRPITDRLYRLYRQDTGSHAPDGGPTADDNEPVVGVRLRDAVDFTRWVNGITEGEPGYQLPTRAELDDATVRRSLPTCSAWVTPENGKVESALWTPAGSAHPHSIDLPTLTYHIGDDIERSMPQFVRLLLLRCIVAVHCLENARTATKAVHAEYVEQLCRALDHEDQHDHLQLRNLARELDAAHDRMLDIAGDLGRFVEMIGVLEPKNPLDRRRARILVADLNNKRVLSEYEHELAEESEQSLIRMLEHALDATESDGAVGSIVRADRTRVHGPHERASYPDALAHALGEALSAAQPRTAGHDSRGAWPAALCRELLRVTGIPETEFVAFPDALADRVGEGCATVRDTLAGSWAAEVAEALQRVAMPAVSRPWLEPLPENTATAVRLAAFLLAAEAGTRGLAGLRATFLEIAAGVTFLQRRARDDSGLITQTIILALA